MDSASEARFAEWATPRLAALHRFAYLLSGDWHVAEDLLQDALAKTALHWARIESARHPDAYVRKIIVNRSRENWRRPAHRLLRFAAVEVAVADTANEHATRDEIVQALRQLPAKQRAAIVLRYFEQLSEAETAQLLGCSIGTVKSQTSKGLASLRSLMSKEQLSC